MTSISNKRSSLFLYIGLFLLTFLTVTLAGVQWVNKDPFELANLPFGLPYSIALLAFLAAHEFGHYFAARVHNVQTTLPYFIPMPHILSPFGTMGAVIRIRSALPSQRVLFDIGIAGPIAGLIVSLATLIFGYFTLPSQEYLFLIHPEYRSLQVLPSSGFAFGDSILIASFNNIFGSTGFVPPMTEIYHYPYLCAGWFGLFVTALNLIPVGQLDGGHILYSLVGGRKQEIVARVFTILLVLLGLVSLLPGRTMQMGSIGWLLWAAILFFIVKLRHPEVPDTEPLTQGRRILGWTMLFVFILTFPPVPFWNLVSSTP